MGDVKKLASIVKSLEHSPDAQGLARGLILRLQIVEGFAVLHAGREGVRPSDEEMDTLMRAVVHAYKPLCVLQGLEDEAHGRWVKRYLFWPVRECKMSWKRAAVQMRIEI